MTFNNLKKKNLIQQIGSNHVKVHMENAESHDLENRVHANSFGEDSWVSFIRRMYLFQPKTPDQHSWYMSIILESIALQKARLSPELTLAAKQFQSNKNGPASTNMLKHHAKTSEM